MGIEMSVVLPLTTFLGFFFGELIPKSIALESSESSAKYLLPIVKLFYLVAKPLVIFTANVSTRIAKLVFHSSAQSTIFERRDVYRFLGNTVSSGYLDKIESELIRKLLINANLPVKNFSVPRTQIVAVKLATGIDKLREIFEKTGKTKVLVFDSSLDNIVGVVHAKDIFIEVEKVDQLISDVLFVPENITIIDLLEEFRTERVYVAILIDEFGGTSGLVTSSDIMEVFLGDVVPLVGQTEAKLKRINSRQYIIHGSTEVTELETSLRIKLSKGDFTTVAGLMISRVGKIPSEGEKIYIDGYEFQVLKSDGRKLESLKLTL
jgi:CBS domain containing-hemolysin-like protein